MTYVVSEEDRPPTAYMLSELPLKNFRGFDNHKVCFRELSVVVGANNAGKSTMVEALRFVSILTNRYRDLKFRRPIQLFEEHGAHAGVSLSLKNIVVNFEHGFHRYGAPPAIITPTFSDRRKAQGTRRQRLRLLDPLCCHALLTA